MNDWAKYTKVRYANGGNIQYTIKKTHISDVRGGDTIVVNGELKTVCGKDIHRDSFIGITIFGDSYMGGTSLFWLQIFFTQNLK